ncbi:hypothetical protein ACT8ZV_22155 [Nocardioides sp. MAHUQ-72]|uniref:hypothetical protein n=1 Tax=unclassified Nocardioides TaxID=2615069 RepID=UPI00360F1854
MIDGEPARQVQDELEAAQEAVADHQRLTGRVDRAQRAVQGASQVLVEARSVLGRETSDVAKLESFSPTRIWAGLRGSRDVDLAREQAEQQAAAYAVAQAESRLAQARAEHDAAAAALAALGDVAARRERALAAKEELLTASGAPGGTELTAIAGELGGLRSQLHEVRQALDAAGAAAARLADAGVMLGKAHDWSTYDTFLDGGMLGDMMKYDRMDRASALMREADRAMRHLSTELADVGVAGVGGVEVTGLVQAFDVWFDNIFSDWSVRTRIAEAARRTDAAAAAVHRVRAGLGARETELAGAVARLAARREELLLSPA